MPKSSRYTARRVGQVGTGLGALIVLTGLLVGAPLALTALAGNPLPDHVPGLREIGAVLTSRDDGQLFLRALALVGWAGWATFALSVLVELPARALRRPALRLPGLGRQQRAAAVLLGSVALILAAGPAASAAASTMAAPVAATAPRAPATVAAPATVEALSGGTSLSRATPLSGGTGPAAGPGVESGRAPDWLAAAPPAGPLPEPVYRVERDDYLGRIADRYLGDFDRYPELVRLNKIRDADLIRPGQLLHLPDEATDRGVRNHATGLVAIPPPPGGWPEAGGPEGGVPGDGVPGDGTLGDGTLGDGTLGGGALGDGTLGDGGQPVGGPESAGSAGSGESPDERHDGKTRVTFGASNAAKVDALNRPLAVSAVIAAAGIVGAQVGAVLSLRRRPAPGGAGDSGRHRLRRRSRG
jgi:hypothetical protein